ncbi:MAG TPA: hypothetical protein VGY53_10400 [Isosphaeraceae bacterium]|jgi:hypothetical protein|nr:hypothetical protein [Isosphaeraceae bacterium]
MRCGYWRGVTLAIALVLAGTILAPSRAQAGSLLDPTIPRVTNAVDLNTGQPMYAPPVPYGHYAKGHGSMLGGGLGCLKCQLAGLGHGKHCGKCGDDGCDPCRQHPFAGLHCKLCGGMGAGCGLCSGMGKPCASSQMLPKHHMVSSQTLPSAQCKSCRGAGCGLCKGLHRRSDCDSCGGAGCGLCKGLFHGSGCGHCGGAGCGLCGGLGAMLHHKKIKYFVGAGGPVPLTPGYVPYVVTTRSPRDFFAFPPFTPDAP